MRKMPRGSHFALIFLMLPWAIQATGQVKPGIEVLRERGFDILQGKRVGLVTNPTGVDSRLRSTIDILYGNVDLRLLFAPEHGVRGEFSAGDHVGDRVDDRTGIPVVSLYGSSRKPDAEALGQVDVIVYDIQDLGVRSYTYISTMGLVMEAAAGHDKEVVILDRPNPLGGLRVEGPPVEEGYHSFVSQYNIPYVYGLTCGELARYLNGEGLLAGGVHCNLHVVPMEGWTRSMTFGDTKLPWVPTSPHIPSKEAAFGYPATGIIGELDGSMIGIGYTLPFQVLVTDAVPAEALADAMNGLGLNGLIFRPIHLRPYYTDRKGQTLQGVQVHITDPARAPLTEVQFWFLQEAHRLDPEFDPFRGREDRYRMFDQVCGSDRMRTSLMKDYNFKPLTTYWNGQARNFRERAAGYTLYKQ